MRIHDLKRGDLFELEGGNYETWMVGERVILAFVLDEFLERIPDPDAIDGYKSTAFSDLRFNREHYTDEDALLDSLL